MLSQTALEFIKWHFPIEHQPEIISEIESYLNLLKVEYKIKEDENRITFAILKSSSGNYNKFKEVMELANLDFRDLLVGAGFGNDVTIHKEWEKEIIIKMQNFNQYTKKKT